MTNDKKDESSPLPKNDALQFFGVITASVTHELNNILSIIDQSAGLIEDFLGAPSGMVLTEEKLKQIIGKIRKNSQRGIGVVKHLNTFAHSTDEPDAAFNANTMLENLGALTRRFADLKAVNMEMVIPQTPIEIKADAYLVRRILYEAFRQLLALAQKNDTLKISLSSENSDGVICIEGRLAEKKGEIDCGLLENITAFAGGTFKAVAGDTGIKCYFRFPSAK
ncbi:MAG: hypothetical protein AB1746_07485 [Candidatus Zixiibacteriota bacterium]